jgi:hypothetical protein
MEAEIVARHPVGRMGQPEEIADAASFVTGHTMTVDGGYVAQSPERPGCVALFPHRMPVPYPDHLWEQAFPGLGVFHKNGANRAALSGFEDFLGRIS